MALANLRVELSQTFWVGSQFIQSLCFQAPAKFVYLCVFLSTADPFSRAQRWQSCSANGSSVWITHEGKASWQLFSIPCKALCPLLYPRFKCSLEVCRCLFRGMDDPWPPKQHMTAVSEKWAKAPKWSSQRWSWNFKLHMQTNRNCWRHCSFFFHSMHTHSQSAASLQTCIFSFRRPTPLSRPGHQSAFPPGRRCDRGAVRASQLEALMLSRSDRVTGRNVPNKQPVILLCPFSYNPLSNQSADGVGKCTDTQTWRHTSNMHPTHT